MEWLLVLAFFACWCFIGAFLAGIAELDDSEELVPAVLFWPLLLCCMIGYALYCIGGAIRAIFR